MKANAPYMRLLIEKVETGLHIGRDEFKALGRVQFLTVLLNGLIESTIMLRHGGGHIKVRHYIISNWPEEILEVSIKYSRIFCF